MNRTLFWLRTLLPRLPWRRLLFWLTGYLPARLIKLGEDESRAYLERYHLFRLFGITVYLHRFVGSDGDRHLHDHPWSWAWSLVLAGGYQERLAMGRTPGGAYFTERIYRSAGSLHRLYGHTWHQITETEPETWTMFVTGPRVKAWGFVGPTGWYQPGSSPGPDWKRTAKRGRYIGREAMA